MGKAILITGSSTGIGYVAAHELQKRGYKVIASCRAQQDVDRLNQEGLTCIQLDLTDEKSIKSAVQKALILCEVTSMRCLTTVLMVNLER